MRQLLLALLCTSAAFAQQDMHLFLLIGQSNMAGRGKVEPADKEPIPRVLSLSKDLAWVPAVDPLHWDKPKVVGVGLGRSFAKMYAEKHPTATIGLIPCAQGGSPIRSWLPGAFFDQTNSHPWDDMLARLRVALKHGSIKGILWHQGEADTLDDRPPLYEAALRDLIARVRKECGGDDIPFVIGQLGQFEGIPWTTPRQMVDAAHQQIAKEVKQCAFVRSDGLTHGGDKVHFDAASFRNFGLRYFAAFDELLKR